MTYQKPRLVIATPQQAGVVKPDGRTVMVTADGTISVRTISGGGPSGPGGITPVLPPARPTAPGTPPAIPGDPIEGLRPPGVKTAGNDKRFKVKRGIDLQNTNIINAVLIPTQPDELASKEYVDQVAAGGGSGVLGLTQNAADQLYARLDGATFSGPIEVLDAQNPQEPVTLGQLEAFRVSIPDLGGLPGIASPVEGMTAYVETTGQLYTYQSGVWVGVSTYDNPQGGPLPTPGTPLVRGATVGEKIDLGTTRFEWNGFAWDRLAPIDFSRVADLERNVGDVMSREFVAPRKNEIKANSAGINDLNAFLEPGSYRILAAVHSPAASGSLIVSQLGSGPGIGTNVAVEQIFFAWTEGTTAATIDVGDVYVRVGYGQTWSPWERLNQQWVEDLVNSRVGFGKRFVGIYDATNAQIVALAEGIPSPYVSGNSLPDPTTVLDRDYLVVRVGGVAPLADAMLPANDLDGTPLELRDGDYLVVVEGEWRKVTNSGALPIDAIDVNYSNGNSGLGATHVQAAIDELALNAGAWRDILGNDDPVAAGASLDIIAGIEGLMCEIDLYVQAGANYWSGKIVGALFGADFHYSVAWEQQVGADIDLGLVPSLDITGTLVTISVNPVVDIDKIRGKYMAI